MWLPLTNCPTVRLFVHLFALPAKSLIGSKDPSVAARKKRSVGGWMSNMFIINNRILYLNKILIEYNWIRYCLRKTSQSDMQGTIWEFKIIVYAFPMVVIYLIVFMVFLY